MDIWFSDHKFKQNNYKNLKNTVKKCKKAAECFDRHFSKEESAVNSQRSNICAERAIKVVQGIQNPNPMTLNQTLILCDVL